MVCPWGIGVPRKADANAPPLGVVDRVVAPQGDLPEDPHGPQRGRQIDALDGEGAVVAEGLCIVLTIQDDVHGTPGLCIEAEGQERHGLPASADGVQQLVHLGGRTHHQRAPRVHGYTAPRALAGVVAEAKWLPMHVDVAHGHQPVALLVCLPQHGQPLQSSRPVLEALRPVAAEGDLAALVHIQIAQEHSEHGLANGAVCPEASYKVEAGAGRKPREAQTEYAVEGQLREGEAGLLDDTQEVHSGADPFGRRVSAAHTDAVADVLAREFPGAVGDGRRVPALPRPHGRAVLQSQLHRRARVLAGEAAVVMASVVVTLHSGQHYVPRARVEDHVEGLRGVAHLHAAVVLADMDLMTPRGV
mmetsp:Transcript_77568/g.250994  ORF Transcript_77568/g.250994 Transcript_77568/m.250994 type:complete len:360 (-) Transcript_77568:155-1234(-)